MKRLLLPIYRAFRLKCEKLCIYVLIFFFWKFGKMLAILWECAVFSEKANEQVWPWQKKPLANSPFSDEQAKFIIFEFGRLQSVTAVRRSEKTRILGK